MKKASCFFFNKANNNQNKQQPRQISTKAIVVKDKVIV